MSATTDRLQVHKAVLAAMGVADLAATGSLTLRGNVVPQVGLTRGDMEPLGLPTAFQAATRFQAGILQEGVGGSARLLNVQPFPVTSSLPDPRLDHDHQIFPLDRSYWVARWITLEADTTVVLRQPLASLVILAEELAVGENVTFSWERLRRDPPLPPGRPAKPPKAVATGLGGVTGLPGIPGRAGDPGYDGRDGPAIEVWVLELYGSPGFDVRGQDGGQGGQGQDGGEGGDGSDGLPARLDAFGFCRSGPGAGGDGGPGGRAGDGGHGGTGSRGGLLTVYAPQPVLARYASGFLALVSGGAAGPGGPPGTPGAGGAGGAVGGSAGGRCPPPPERHAGGPGLQGAPGVQGPPGQPGGHQENPTRLLEITQAEFEAALARTAIETMRPNPAHAGDRIAAAGRNFAAGDIVLLDDLPCETTIGSDTQLAFTVPAATGGGLHRAQVRHADGTTSFPATLEILPLITGTEPAGRQAPGSVVTLLGSGFTSEAVVRVNDQSATDTHVLDATRVQFTLMRPDDVAPDPGGEHVKVTVVLPDGTASNDYDLVIDTFHVLVIGDSIQWGQGLLEEQKISTLVIDALKARMGNIGVYRDRLAHSGASIDAIGSDAGRPGEVPFFFPTIIQQCDAYAGATDTIDLLLCDGGINDIDVRTILNPATSTAELEASIRAHCYDGMKRLLAKILAKFTHPNLRVVVTGYYPIISEYSATAMLPLVLASLGIEMQLAVADAQQRIVLNCRIFASESAAQLRRAVDEANAGVADGRRVLVAIPDIGPEHAALTPDPYLWGLNADSSPQDPVAGSRWPACEAAFPAGVDRELCRRASMGHPNLKGARAYADAIMLQLQG